jgi:hypothetical protein
MISIGSVLEANSIAAANYSTVTGMVGSPVIALDSCELVGIHVGCVHTPQNNYNNFITVHHEQFVYHYCYHVLHRLEKSQYYPLLRLWLEMHKWILFPNKVE